MTIKFLWIWKIIRPYAEEIRILPRTVKGQLKTFFNWRIKSQDICMVVVMNLYTILDFSWSHLNQLGLTQFILSRPLSFDLVQVHWETFHKSLNFSAGICSTRRQYIIYALKEQWNFLEFIIRNILVNAR